MATNYPNSLDDDTSLPNPGSNSFTNNPSHAGQHDTENDAIKAVQAKVGIGASTPVANRVFRGTGSGTSAWAQLDLTTDVTGTLPVANGGTGVTSLTLPGSGIVVGTTDVQDVTNKTLHDTFMGETFISQSATVRNITLDASTNFLKTELLEVGGSFTFEIPATSTLEIKAFPPVQITGSTGIVDNSIPGTKISSYRIPGQADTTNTTLTGAIIQSGWGYIQGNGTAQATKTVTFPVAFTTSIVTVIISHVGFTVTTPPSAFTSFNTQASGNIVDVHQINASVSGFTACFTAEQGTTVGNTVYVGFSWIAIGQ